MKTTYTVMSYARGLTVLVMPAVHVVMVYGSPAIYQTGLVYMLRFFAEGPGAQLFMFSMGFFLTMKSTTRQKGWQRGIILFLAGYGLNAIRLYLPGRFGWLPIELVSAYTVTPTTDPSLPLLLMGDILQFAGIGYGLISWLYCNVNGYIVPLTLYLVLALLAPFCWGLHSNVVAVDYLLGLFFAEDARAFFPVFPWLCYPLAGYITGQVFRQTTEPIFYRLISKAGLSLLLIGIVIRQLEPPLWELDFYRSGPGTTIAYTGFQLIWIYFLRICINYLPSVHIWKRLLLFCSEHITAIYLVHWILIGWGIGLVGYQQLRVPAIYLVILVVSILSFTLVYFFQRQKRLKIFSS